MSAQHASIGRMDDHNHMSWKQGQSIAAVTLGAMLIAVAITTGAAYLSSRVGVLWWVVAPAAWVGAYLTMRAILRYFFTRRMPAA